MYSSHLQCIYRVHGETIWEFGPIKLHTDDISSTQYQCFPMHDHRTQNTLPVSSLDTILRTLLWSGLSSNGCSELYVTLYRLTRELIRCDRSPTAFLSILISRTLPVLLSRNELRLSAAYDSKTGENYINKDCRVKEKWQTREKM